MTSFSTAAKFAPQLLSLTNHPNPSFAVKQLLTAYIAQVRRETGFPAIQVLEELFGNDQVHSQEAVRFSKAPSSQIRTNNHAQNHDPSPLGNTC
jgi:hypothetical protein